MDMTQEWGKQWRERSHIAVRSRVDGAWSGWHDQVGFFVRQLADNDTNAAEGAVNIKSCYDTTTLFKNTMLIVFI